MRGAATQESTSTRPIPTLSGSRIVWRSPLTGEPVRRDTPGVAPRGPRGLWRALVAATREPTIDLTDEPGRVGPTPPPAAGARLVDDEAHLAYLARVAFARAGESIKARTPETRVHRAANVVELDAFRRRHRR
jgi:hypothetical protein